MLYDYIKKYSLIFQKQCITGINQYFLVAYLEILFFLNSVLLEHIKLINFYAIKIKEHLEILNKYYIDFRKWINLETFYQKKISTKLMLKEQREYDHLIRNYFLFVSKK